MCVYYDAIDHFGHAFMKYHPPQRPQVDDWDFRVFNHCVEMGYIFHDAMLGTLLDLAGEDVTVILMSDHGFHPDNLRLSNIPREPAGPAAEHRQFGIFAASGPGIRQDERIYGASLIECLPDHAPPLRPARGRGHGRQGADRYLRESPCGNPAHPQLGRRARRPRHAPAGQANLRGRLQGRPPAARALGYIEEPDADQSKAIEQTVRELDYNLAQAWIDGGYFAEAVAILERLYQKWPMEHRFGFRLSGCYQSQGRTADLRAMVTTVSERRMQEASEAIATFQELKLDTEEARQAEKERIEAMSDAEKEKFGHERRELIAKSRPNLFALRHMEASADLAENATRTPSPSLSKWTATSARGATPSPCVAKCSSGSSAGTIPAPRSKKRSPSTPSHPPRCRAWPAPRWPRGISRAPSSTPAPLACSYFQQGA